MPVLRFIERVKLCRAFKNSALLNSIQLLCLLFQSGDVGAVGAFDEGDELALAF